MDIGYICSTKDKNKYKYKLLKNFTVNALFIYIKISFFKKGSLK